MKEVKTMFMGLQDLKEELYKRDGQDRKEIRRSPFDLRTTSAPENPSREAFQKERSWGDGAQRLTLMNGPHAKAIRRGLIAFAVVAVAGIAWLTYIRIQQSAFSSDRVTLQVDGPSNVSGSGPSSFVFTYANANRSALTDVDLILTYPENFHPDPLTNMSINGSSSQIHMPTIAGHERGKIEVRGQFHGSKGSIAYVKGVLRYKPESVGSSFQTESQIAVTIQTPSIDLSVEAPLQVASGGDVEYRVDYANISDTPFRNLRLKVEYPDGFHPKESSPKASEGDALWYVGDMAPGQSGSVRIVGTLDGAKNEAKVFRAHIGMLQGNGDLLSYSDGERLTTIVTSPLLVQQAVNGLNQLTVNPGANLNYDIHYRNDGPVGLRNVIITFEVQGSVLDFSKLKSSGGAFDDSKKTVTWKASDVPNLANLGPGEEGSVTVTVPVSNTIAPKSEADKDFIVTSIAKIDSPDIPTPTGSNKIIGSNALRVKIGSGIGLQTSFAFQDGAIANTGPTPPQVGQETTYTLHWVVTGGTNDIDQAVATAYLPTGARWTGKIAPSSESVTYNERTNQIVWNIGSVPSGTGFFKPAREVAFQVAVTPQSNQVGQSASLLGETSLTAHNIFTDQPLQAKVGAQSVGVQN